MPDGPTTAQAAPCSADEKVVARPFLSDDALRRLCVGLIRLEQERLRKAGSLDPRKAEVLRRPGTAISELDEIDIDQETLGFDSLALLELILSLNRFFGLHRTGVEDYLLVQRRIGSWITLLAEHFARAPDDLSMTFATSGSSGTPKQITHRCDRMTAEIRATLAGPLRMMPPHGRILALVPPHHIYGFLFTALLPSLSGHEVLDLHEAGPGAAFRNAKPGDLIVGTPFNWETLGRINARFPEAVHGVVSAGPTTQTTWDIVEKTQLSSLTEVYGSTETLGVATRTAFEAPFELMSHLDRDDGAIMVAGEPLPLQDKLVWTGSRSFTLHGRLDNVVQVAGVNVNLTLVRDLLLAFDGVEDALVRHDGQRVKAFVQTSGNEAAQSALESQIRTNLSAKLPAAALPHSIRFGSALPRNAMGKLCDWKTADLDETA